MLKDGGLNNRVQRLRIGAVCLYEFIPVLRNAIYKQIKLADDLVKSEDKMEKQLFTKMKSPPKYSDSCE